MLTHQAALCNSYMHILQSITLIQAAVCLQVLKTILTWRQRKDLASSRGTAAAAQGKASQSKSAVASQSNDSSVTQQPAASTASSPAKPAKDTHNKGHKIAGKRKNEARADKMVSGMQEMHHQQMVEMKAMSAANNEALNSMGGRFTSVRVHPS